jgi:hypothetical protein
LLLCDDQGHVVKELREYIEQWPPEFRTEGIKALSQLMKRNRLVTINSALPLTSGIRPSCVGALGVLSSNTGALLFLPRSCLCGGYCDSARPSAIQIDQYQLLDDILTSHWNCSDGLELNYGDWTRIEFEEKVWQPLFSHAKNVRVFDRVIGTKVSDRMLRHKVRSRQQMSRASLGTLEDIADNFATSLNWIFQQFLTHSDPSQRELFEVTCELRRSYNRDGDKITFSDDEMRVGAEVLTDFSLFMGHSYDFDFSIVVKEAGRTGLPHARYLFTDQTQLLVDRGFDLLSGNRVRDVIIKFVDDPGRVEKLIRRLRDVR